MKKIIIPIVALLAIIGTVNAQDTLYEWYNKKLPSISERAEVYKHISDDEYIGSAIQNIQLLKHLKGKDTYLKVITDPFSQTEILSGWGDKLFGAETGQRPSDFKTNLGESLDGTASTTEEITLSSVTTVDGHALTSDDIGDFMCFKINPGASNRELICCSGGISGTTLQDCTRGYNFYDSSTSAARAKPHSPGETVIISNDDLYLTTQYPSKDDDETITGTHTFASTTAISRIRIGDGTSTYDKRVYAYNADTNLPFLQYDESANTWSFSNNGIDSTAIGSGASVYTAGDGLLLTASDFDIYISATSSGLYFTGISDDQLNIQTGYGMTVNSVGQLQVSTSSNYAFTGNFSINGTEIGSISSNVTDTNLNQITGGGGTALHQHGSSTAYFNKWGLLDMFQDNTVVIGGVMVDASETGTLAQASGGMKCSTGASTGQSCEATSNNAPVNYASSSILYMRLKLGEDVNNSAQRTHWGTQDASTDAGAGGALTSDHCAFMYMGRIDGVDGTHTGLFSSVADGSTQSTTTITGVDLTSYNDFKIEYTAGVSCKFYVNDTLKTTESSNIPDTADEASQVRFSIETLAETDMTLQLGGNWVFIQDY